MTQSALRDLVILEDGTGWAVGEAGTIARFTGTSWQPTTSPTDETLHAVAFTSATEGWAVGEAGTILRYAGDQWQPAGAPTTAADDLFDVALTADGGWAVGRRYNTTSEQFEALILRLDAGTWSAVPVPDAHTLRAVAFASADDGWAVGDSGTVLRWDGADWTAPDTPTTFDLHDVTVAGDDVWAVSDRGAFIRWTDEGSQIILTPQEVTLTAIAFAGPDRGYAVGQAGTVLQYDGRQWSPLELNVPLEPDLFGLFIDAAGTPWASGAGGLIGQITPDGWTFTAQPYFNVDLLAIDVLNTTAGWVVGSNPPPNHEGVVFWKPGATRWTPQHDRDARPLFDVDTVTENEAWAVGQDHTVGDPEDAGIIWHYADGDWQLAVQPGVSALFAVDGSGPKDVWAAGQDGALLHYDGNTWHSVDTLSPSTHIYGLHIRAADDGWAGGEELDLENLPPEHVAVAFHFDGETWQATDVPQTAWTDQTSLATRPRLLAVYALSATDVWAVGNAGAILHYDGQDWSVMQGQQDYVLTDVDFAHAKDGWAVGSGGTILHYDGQAWSHVESPTTETLNGVVSRPWNAAWAVGSDGAFLYHRPVLPARAYLPLIIR